jgi:hypothetical protein
MTITSRSSKPIPLGQMAIYTQLGLLIPPPAVQSYAVSAARRTRELTTHTEEHYPLHYSTDGSIKENLRFAIKHEPLDLRIIFEALVALGDEVMVDWVHDEPSGEFSRRAWFLYETLTGHILDLAPAQLGRYVDVLNPKRHYVGVPRISARHRVRDNLLGSIHLCPVLRRTHKLEAMIQANLADEARALTQSHTPETLARAISFLYTKETRSSFAIEGEPPSRMREERYLQALRSIESFHPNDKDELIRLQQNIVDPRYASDNWRTSQNFVSETTRQFGQDVHYICPRPEDVDSLMEGWMVLTDRLMQSPLDAVLAAAVCAFAFVFIHPFEDGNGRIHRFIIHYGLAKRGFSPPGIIFPVSAAILRNKLAYEQVLDGFSHPMLAAVEWEWADNGDMVVRNNTLNLYRFFDVTALAEYLYDRVAETVRVDFKEELDFLETYDAAYMAVKSIVDMPTRRAALLVNICLQNGGHLSNNRRKDFIELTDEEIVQIEYAIKGVVQKAGGVLPDSGNML